MDDSMAPILQQNDSSNNLVERKKHIDAMYGSDWLQSNYTGRDLDEVVDMHPMQLLRRTLTSSHIASIAHYGLPSPPFSPIVQIC